MTSMTDLPVFLTLGQEDKPPTAPKTDTTTATGQDGSPPPTGTDGNQQPVGQPQSPGGFNPMLIMLLVVGFFFVIMMSGQRKQKKKQEALLASLKKGEKVQTIGGIRGTIVEVRDHEIVVKVDENNNTRLRFSREAVQTVITERETDDKAAEKKAE